MSMLHAARRVSRPAAMAEAAKRSGYEGGGVAPKVTRVDGKSYFHMGPRTHQVPYAMHRRHRDRLCARLRPQCAPGSYVVVQGGEEKAVYDTDTVWDFKQESNFQWLFGVKEPGCIAAISVETGRSHLFIPKFPPSYASWMGPIKPPQWFKDTYEVDEVTFVEEAGPALTGAGARELVVLNGTNRDSGISTSASHPAKFVGIDGFKLRDDQLLWNEMSELRVVKDDDEIALMQWTNDVTSKAHIEVQRHCKGANVMEYLSEATFRYHSFLKGCARVGYHCICPGGDRNAVLHYGHSGEPNEKEVDPTCLRLHDMGAEYHCYTADVTVTWPQQGTFSPEQKIVYDTVWAATLAVERAMGPGVCWVAMHKLAERTMLEQMTAAGLLKGSVDDMVAADLCATFMPHGLGHMLGLDVHDVGGYEPGHSRADLKQAQPHPVTQNLRCGRKLAAGNVITVEPGFYFTDFLLEEALADPERARFIDAARLAQLRHVGGVRIEDNVLVTATGCRVLTRVPRETADVEATIAGTGDWEEPCREYCVGA